jgi:hypothetical protein
MYYLQALMGDKYFVVDTADNSIDECTSSEMVDFNKLGISIVGFNTGSVVEPMNTKFVTVFEIGGVLYGVNKYSEVYYSTPRGFKQAYAKMFFAPESKISLLSKHKISEANFDTIICVEEKWRINKSSIFSLKTQVFKVNTKTHVFARVDGMEDFIAGKHRVLQPKEGGIYYGRKLVARA